ncbi:unnamed protein product [Trifolium pratense]|uniref:Uncharacterized protein n=1 Tax=Trifolium pratense TaxID=57577 RepID=A0ACB0JIX2_TRIPR|nr:unnamed protein product [Trifolium pratense]
MCSGIESGPVRKQVDLSELFKYKQMEEKAKHDEKETKKLHDSLQVVKRAEKFCWSKEEIREATLFALSSLSEQLLEKHESGFRTSNLKNMIEQIVAEDFLIDRHSFSVKLLTSLNLQISNQVLEHSLDAALKAIIMNVSPPVKVGACRAFAQLLPKAKKVIVQPQLFGLFSSLTDLLNHASYGFLAYGT